MNNKILITIFVLSILIFGAYLFFKKDMVKNGAAAEFKQISSKELALMLSEKDFKLIDVHIPEQRHIPGTDYLIPFNEIDKIVEAFPDKNEKIVLYCRSGGMSSRVAKNLVKRGYTNIFNLEKGFDQWSSEGRETLPKGGI